MFRSIKFFAKTCLCAVVLCQFSLAQGGANYKAANVSVKQTSGALPTVKQIDIDGLKKLLKPNGKPLLINFWATWCDPCREEFPELVRVDAAYKGKINFLTVSLDELSDIKTYVPQFLGEMKAEMPAYLLHTPDENAAIAAVSKEWNGNLPLTIMFSPTGETVYLRKGKIKFETVTAEIDKLLTPPPAK